MLLRTAALLCCFSLGCKNKSGPPDLNETFEDPNMNVEGFIEQFESEDRSVFVHREKIVAALGVEPGTSVADIGAGTGFFLEHFAKAVGAEGSVYAVEISPKFVEHIEELAAAKKLSNVKAVLGSDRSVKLPDGSIDLALIVETYHHFDAPAEVMASIHRALRPGGRVALIDMTRVEGVTTDEWVLNHVRAGEAEFSKEIEAAGFTKEAAPAVPYLEKVYLAMFRKK